MRISSTNATQIQNMKILAYGDPGSGKTSLAKTVKEPVLIISSEAGLLCLADAEPPIDVLDITLDDEGLPLPKERRIERLGQAYQYLLTDECKEKYKWVFIDSLTEISENMIESLYVEFPERKDSLPMYQENNKRMRGLIKGFRDLPFYNIVFTALPALEKDESNRRYVGISMVGKIGEKLPAFFDEVFYLRAVEDTETGEIKRHFITAKTEGLVCKDRSGKLDRFEPADLTHIMNKIRR